MEAKPINLFTVLVHAVTARENDLLALEVQQIALFMIVQSLEEDVRGHAAMDHLHNVQVVVQLPPSFLEDLHIVCSSLESCRTLFGLTGTAKSAKYVTEVVSKRVLDSLSIDNQLV